MPDSLLGQIGLLLGAIGLPLYLMVVVFRKWDIIRAYKNSLMALKLRKKVNLYLSKKFKMTRLQAIRKYGIGVDDTVSFRLGTLLPGSTRNGRKYTFKINYKDRNIVVR